MTYAVDEFAAAELADDGGGFGLAIMVALAESAYDTFAAALLAVPHAIAVLVSAVELGDDTFAASITQPEGSDLGEPITLGEAKLAARLDSSIRIFDTDIARSVSAARLLAEQATGREFVRKTRRFTFTDFPSATHVLNVFEPVAVAISWWTGSAWQAMDVADYAYWEQGCGTGIGPAVPITFIPSSNQPMNNNGEMSFDQVSNTQIKLKFRGSDGVTRSTTFTVT